MDGSSMLVKFEIFDDRDHWCARGMGQSIFTRGKTLDVVRSNMEEAVQLHFEAQFLLALIRTFESRKPSPLFSSQEIGFINPFPPIFAKGPIHIRPSRSTSRIGRTR